MQTLTGVIPFLPVREMCSLDTHEIVIVSAFSVLRVLSLHEILRRQLEPRILNIDNLL